MVSVCHNLFAKCVALNCTTPLIATPTVLQKYIFVKLLLYAIALLTASGWRHYVSGCLSVRCLSVRPSCEGDISSRSQEILHIIFGTNIHLDSRINSLDFGVKGQGHKGLTNYVYVFFYHTSLECDRTACTIYDGKHSWKSRCYVCSYQRLTTYSLSVTTGCSELEVTPSSCFSRTVGHAGVT